MTNKFLFGITGGKTRFLTYTAVALAVTVLGQYLASLAGLQLLTGSIVNMFLLLAATICGALGGMIVGVVTPFIALALGINANVVLVPFIALGNAIFVVVYSLNAFVSTDKVWLHYLGKIAAVIVGALLKYVFMYFVCVEAIFPLFVQAELLKPQALTKLATAWGLIQLFAALIGGAAAIALDAALLRKKVLPSLQKQN